jgi:tight adherence protein C
MGFTQGLMLHVAALGFGASALLLLLGMQQLHQMVVEEDRTWMDPLPPLLKFIWPLIQIISFFFCSILPYEMMEKTDVRLQHSGVGYLLTAEQFVALKIIGLFAGFLFAVYVMLSFGSDQPLWLIFGPLIGFFLPEFWLNDSRKRRELAVIRAMPTYLDFITMAVEAGLNLQGALAQAMEKAPPSPLRNEFGIVLRDLRSGLPRADALRRMADRLEINEVTSFVSSMIQAERMGSSLAAVLRIQAEQRRNERFQRAEKMAMEAPIKLTFPLIAFIFPVTFIVLGFPIAMKFMSEGMF